MLPSFLLALRETLEASLVVGIVLGILRKLGREDCSRNVWLAAGSAVVVSAVAAVLLRAFSLGVRGAAEPLTEGATLFLAAVLLTWMIAWMNGRAGEIRTRIEGQVRQATGSPGVRGVFAVTFIAVAREGTELAFFLTAAAIDSSGTQTLAGATLGIAFAAGLAWALFATTTRLDLVRFFQVTTMLLILFAAGLVAKGIHEFNEVGWIPGVIEPVWNTRGLLNEHSFVGTAARTLLGYTSTPSLSAVLGYGLYLAASIALLRFGRRKARVQPSAVTIPTNRAAV